MPKISLHLFHVDVLHCVESRLDFDTSAVEGEKVSLALTFNQI